MNIVVSPRVLIKSAPPPGLIISPLVEAGRIYDKPLDHTSILAFLAEKFGRRDTYSTEVESRKTTFTGRIADILSLQSPRTNVPFPPGALTGENMNAVAFKRAAAAMTDHDADAMTNKFPELRSFVRGL